MTSLKEWNTENIKDNDINGNFDKSIIRQLASSQDTTEYSVTSSSFADIGYSKTLTLTNYDVIKYIKIALDTKGDHIDGYWLRCKITNDTSDVFYIDLEVPNTSEPIFYQGNETTYTSISRIGTPYRINHNSSYHTSAIEDLSSLFDGTSFTLTFEARYISTSTPAYIKNITITAMVERLQDVEVTGWA